MRGVGDVREAPHECMCSLSVPKTPGKSDGGYYMGRGGAPPHLDCLALGLPRHRHQRFVAGRFLLQTLKNVMFAMKRLKVPRTPKTLDPAQPIMTP